MDSIIVAGAMQSHIRTSLAVTVVAVINKIGDLVMRLVSLFDPATIIAPLLNTGNSLTAVAPDAYSIGGERALAAA